MKHRMASHTTKMDSEDSVTIVRMSCAGLVYACETVQMWVAGASASLLLQQGRDVDVPADGLPVKATGEEITGLILFVPR